MVNVRDKHGSILGVGTFALDDHCAVRVSAINEDGTLDLIRDASGEQRFARGVSPSTLERVESPLLPWSARRALLDYWEDFDMEDAA